MSRIADDCLGDHFAFSVDEPNEVRFRALLGRILHAEQSVAVFFPGLGFDQPSAAEAREQRLHGLLRGRERIVFRERPVFAIADERKRFSRL